MGDSYEIISIEILYGGLLQIDLYCKELDSNIRVFAEPKDFFSKLGEASQKSRDLYGDLIFKYECNKEEKLNGDKTKYNIDDEVWFTRKDDTGLNVHKGIVKHITNEVTPFGTSLYYQMDWSKGYNNIYPKNIIGLTSELTKQQAETRTGELSGK